MNTKRPDDTFGLCPACHQQGRLLNIGPDHYFACHTHRLFWRVGTNLFGYWEHEEETKWGKNSALLADYGELDSGFHWPETLALGRELPPPPLGGAFI